MTKPKYRIGVLGTGHLIQHLVPGLLRGFAATDVLLSPRNAERAAALRDKFGCAIADDNAQVVDSCETILVAVRPFQVEETITGLPWRPDQTVISLCAGVPISVFTKHLNGAAMVRALPVTAAEFGESPTCIYPNDPVAMDILAFCGPVLELKSEDDFEIASIMGAYYGWVQALIGETAG
jgi:pyrroline-5-carboxylate reductase